MPCSVRVLVDLIERRDAGLERSSLLAGADEFLSFEAAVSDGKSA